MGRLIHTNDLHNQVMLNKRDWGIFETTIDNLIEGVVSRVPTVEAIPKDQYETRLKADMVAILTEIQLEIEEQKRDELSYQQTWNYPLNVCVSIIHQKINSLKENTDGRN